jgi:hypothetical protein
MNHFPTNLGSFDIKYIILQKIDVEIFPIFF